MKKNKIWVTGCVVMAISFGTVHWLSQAAANGVEKGEAEAETKTVAVAHVTQESLSRSITLSAEFRPFQEADLRAKVAGYLKSLHVDIGDQVKAGQVVATLDTDELKADSDRYAAALRDARLDFDRISSVNKKRPGLLAQDEVDKAQAMYEMAKANMQRAKAMLEYATIVMPFDGVITKRYVDPGALVQASGTGTPSLPIVHVADNTKLRLYFPVPESDVPDVKVGTPVELTVQATGQTIKGSVSRLAGSVDSATRTMETEVDIDNTDRRIMPGMYASVKIDLEHKEAALSLPIQAVSGGDKPTVWRVNENNEIEERAITLGLQTADKVEIVGGLQAGDRVVFGSRGALSIGMRITPKPVSDRKG